MEIEDRDGKLSQYGIECRPTGTAITEPVTAGFTLTTSQELIVGGTGDQGVVSGQDQAVKLGPTVEGRSTYRVLLPQGRYELIACDDNGREVGRARTGT